MNEGRETLESMSLALWYNRWTLNQFRDYLRGKILEVGCGIGNFTNELLNYGDVWAIDIDQNYIEELKKQKKYKVGLGDIEKGKYFFKNSRFDSIVCLNVVEHIENDQSALENLYKLLNKKGRLILIVPADQILYGEIDRSIGHFKRYDKDALLSTLKKIGFKIIEGRKINFFGGIGWFVAGRILKNKIVQSDKINLFNLIAPLVLPLERFIEPPIGTSLFIIAEK